MPLLIDNDKEKEECREKLLKKRAELGSLQAELARVRRQFQLVTTIDNDFRANTPEGLAEAARDYQTAHHV